MHLDFGTSFWSLLGSQGESQGGPKVPKGSFCVEGMSNLRCPLKAPWALPGRLWDAEGLLWGLP